MKKIFLLAIILSCASCIMHCQTTLPRNVADEFGKLLVYHNNRICPLQTLARDYTIKLTGKTSYKDFTAEQVLLGWFFYYDEWRTEPMIKIKGKEVKDRLNIDGKYASFNDFVSPQGYKLIGTQGKNYSAADEKYNLIMMHLTGSLMRIYPYKSQQSTVDSQQTDNSSLLIPHSSLIWFALNDQLPNKMSEAEQLFIHKSMSLVAEYLTNKEYAQAINLIRQIRIYQDHQLGVLAPSNTKLIAERIYNHLNYNRLLAIILMTLGIISYILTITKPNLYKSLLIPHSSFLILIALYLTLSITLRGYIAGHFPLSNGFETMQFLALIASLIPLFCKSTEYRVQSTDKSSHTTSNSSFLIPHSSLICGVALMVATMSELNPRITLLMPVLQSPLLSIHVMVIMISYALFALLALNSIVNLIRHETQDTRYEMLYWGLFLLTAGIFIGAIWANMSWGRYWGWDPKEVWALITMLIYSLPLHRASLPIFRNERFLNWYFVLAFLSVIITYFGVNFVLGGLHSYA